MANPQRIPVFEHGENGQNFESFDKVKAFIKTIFDSVALVRRDISALNAKGRDGTITTEEQTALGNLKEHLKKFESLYAEYSDQLKFIKARLELDALVAAPNTNAAANANANANTNTAGPAAIEPNNAAPRDAPTYTVESEDNKNIRQDTNYVLDIALLAIQFTIKVPTLCIEIPNPNSPGEMINFDIVHEIRSAMNLAASNVCITDPSFAKDFQNAVTDSKINTDKTGLLAQAFIATNEKLAKTNNDQQAINAIWANGTNFIFDQVNFKEDVLKLYLNFVFAVLTHIAAFKICCDDLKHVARISWENHLKIRGAISACGYFMRSNTHDNLKKFFATSLSNKDRNAILAQASGTTADSPPAKPQQDTTPPKTGSDRPQRASSGSYDKKEKRDGRRDRASSAHQRLRSPPNSAKRHDKKDRRIDSRDSGYDYEARRNDRTDFRRNQGIFPSSKDLGDPNNKEAVAAMERKRGAAKKRRFCMACYYRNAQSLYTHNTEDCTKFARNPPYQDIKR